MNNPYQQFNQQPIQNNPNAINQGNSFPPQQQQFQQQRPNYGFQPQQQYNQQQSTYFSPMANLFRQATGMDFTPQMLGFMQGGGNPQQLLQGMIQQNPVINKAMQMKNENPDMSFIQIAENVARTNGINFEQYKQQFGM